MPIPQTLTRKCDRLVQFIERLGPSAVAYSGGVDSALVASAALRALGDAALAVTAVSPSLAESERHQAAQTAAAIGIAHRELLTNELANPAYTRNGPDRCFHCKSQLYAQMQAKAASWGYATILNGANVDDLGDYRPGQKAGHVWQVISPLIECAITKSEVRQIAKAWNLPVWDKPASPCLSSRVAYGEEVTPERLQMIDAAESCLRARGFSNVRVRFHKNELARIEVATADWMRWTDPKLREEVIGALRNIGFRFITLDMEGFRSGSLNQIVPVDVLRGES